MVLGGVPGFVFCVDYADLGWCVVVCWESGGDERWVNKPKMMETFDWGGVCGVHEI